jgi:flagellar biosynthesis component FlhA
MVLMWVLILAVPVYLVGVMTKSKSALIFAAIIAGVIGVLTGSAEYIFVDLFGVAVAVLAAWSAVNDDK